MDRAIDRIFGDGGGQAGLPAGAFPAVNVWEKEDTLYLEAELPGFEMKDLEIFVTGRELTLRGKREEAPAQDARYHRRERGVGSFERRLQLPTEIEADEVQATAQNGILTVTLPKARSVRPRRIEVVAR
jgi:HSP20 family protein